MSEKPLVKVIWRDICGITSDDNSNAWMNEKQIAESAENLFKHEYVTVGFIVAETDDWIAIAATHDSGKEMLWSDASMIMKAVIIDRKVL